MKIYGIYNCTSFKKALTFFKSKCIEVEEIDLKTHSISISDIKTYHELSGLDIKKFLNTSGKLYRELSLKDKVKDMALSEVYKLLSEQPMLIKRPLIAEDDFVRTGFKLEEYETRWG